MKKFLLLVGLLGMSWPASAYDAGRVQIHGFASQGYLRSNHYDYLTAETEKGTVEFNEFGLNVMSNLTDNLRFGIQMFARDLGDNGNDKLTVDWAFGDYRYRNWLGIRVGKIKRPMGLYNQTRDIDVARTGVFLPSSVYNENFRTAVKSMKGIALYGTLPGGIEYQAQYGTLDSEFADEILMTTPGIVGAEVGDDAYTLHVIWNTPLDGLRLVGTRYTISWTSTLVRNGAEYIDDTDFPAWVGGLEYAWGNATIVAEYKESSFKSKIYDFTSQYYYGLLAYRLTDWLELATSYSVTYVNKADREGNNYFFPGPKAQAWSKDLALSARFDINEFWVVKLEGHWMNGLYGVSNYGENPDEHGFLGAAKVTFSF
jgi:hypothetical protein